MKIITKFLSYCAILLLIATKVFAFNPADGDGYNLKPYIGVDYKYTKMKGHNDWSKILPEDFHGVTFYFGEKFTQYLGLELGYSQFARKTRNPFLTTTDTFFGVNYLGDYRGHNKVRMNSYHLDFNIFYPFKKYFSAFLSVGAAGTKAKLKMMDVLANAQTSDMATIATKRKAVGRVGLGTELLIDRFGIRGIIRYEDTEKLRLITNSLTTSFPEASAKYYLKSVSVNLGVFIQFL